MSNFRSPNDVRAGLKRTLETFAAEARKLQGDPRDPWAAAVTFNDLLELGVCEPELTKFGEIEAGKPPLPVRLRAPMDILRATQPDFLSSVFQPPAPVNAQISQLLYGVLITWAESPYAMQIYRATENSILSAQYIATVYGTQFTDATADGRHYWYWLRHVTISGVTGPFHEVDGLDIGDVADAPRALVAKFSGEFLEVDWDEPNSGHAIKYYTVKYGDTLDGAVFLQLIQASNLKVKVNWGGLRRFWIAAVDINDQVGQYASVDAFVIVPRPVTITVEVIDNNVLLRWSDATATLPINRYEIRKGASWETGVAVGDNGNGRFAAFFEQAAGIFTYWVVGIDTAGNEGSPRFITATVSQPPDYVMRLDYHTDFSLGEKANLAGDGGRIFVPVKDEIYSAHFTNNGWTTPQQQIDAGYPYFAQPSPSTAYYEETIDYGTLIASTTTVVMTVSSEAVYGAVAMTPMLSVRATPFDPWIDYPGATQIAAADFRYLKFRLDFAAAGGDDLLRIADVSVKLLAKAYTDAGSGMASAADIAGTIVNFNIAFADVQSIQVTPAGTTARIALYDFSDIPNPTSFRVLLYDLGGNRVSGAFSWSAKGVR